MAALLKKDLGRRYSGVTDDKVSGATYTPKLLADFVAEQIIARAESLPKKGPIRLLDPAVGQGELLLSLLEDLNTHALKRVEVYGFETDLDSLSVAEQRIKQAYPSISIQFDQQNFLEFVLNGFGCGGNADLFNDSVPETYDLVIANPPYVRTQILGANQAQLLAKQFDLTGRVDLYYAFVLGIAKVLKPKGIAGIIVSNRFMTTKSGAAVRRQILEELNLRHVWDLGDTKLFDAAVLPAVMVSEIKHGHKSEMPGFTSIYVTSEEADHKVRDPIEALATEGVVEVEDGRRFRVQQGKLNTSGSVDGVWRVATEAADAWLATIESHTWGEFSDIGEIRVGVKTCADKVFIRADWNELSEGRPELLRQLTTHHIGQRFKPEIADNPREILYPHEFVDGKRQVVELEKYPVAKAYLASHRDTLSGRKYLIDAGREWYEIWVAQDPGAWDKPKMVFRDISEKPMFWIDLGGSVINGDCYWLVPKDEKGEDLLWLAVAVANSTLIERFYDRRFHNKLYSGRRRFIKQYVEKFPLPDPTSAISKKIVKRTRAVYDSIPFNNAKSLETELNALVWEAFGLVEEVDR